MPAAITTSRDPVCGMDVEPAGSKYSVIHHGLTYHFCSQQCLDRFSETPALYTRAQRSEDIEPIIKKRCLKFLASQPKTLRVLSERIGQMMGIKHVATGNNRLTVEYDLRQVTFAQIEAVTTAAGALPKTGIHNWRRSFWKFGEHNELENLAHAGTGACCSRPPARLR